MERAVVAKDLMNPAVICLKRDATVREAAQLFLARGISGAPVIDAQGMLLGMVSLRDLVRERLESDGEVPAEDDMHRYETLGGHLPRGFHLDRSERTVEAVLTPALVTVRPDAEVDEVCRLMVEKRIHRVLVTQGSYLIGILSTLDILGHLASRRSKVA